MKKFFLIAGIMALLATAAHAQTTPAATAEVATTQTTDTSFRVERDAPRCTQLQFEAVEMTPTMRAEARRLAMARACAQNARLPMTDEVIDLSDGRRIHFNARAVPAAPPPQ